MGKKVEVPNLVVQSKLKEYLSSKGVRTSGDVIENLNTKITHILDDAIIRTQANNRSTVRGADL